MSVEEKAHLTDEQKAELTRIFTVGANIFDDESWGWIVMETIRIDRTVSKRRVSKLADLISSMLAKIIKVLGGVK